MFYLKFKYLMYFVFFISFGFSQTTPCNNEEYLRLKKINNENELSQDEMISFEDYDLKCQNFKKYNHIDENRIKEKNKFFNDPRIKTGITVAAIFLVRYVFSEFFSNPFTY